MSNNVAGIPIKNMISPTETPHGGKTKEEIAERIASLSVPTGLACITPETTHTIIYKSSKPTFVYETIPDALYDKLLGLVSVNPRNTTRAKKDKPVHTRKTSRHKPATLPTDERNK